MNKQDIQLFYNQFVDRDQVTQTDYMGHFDLLYWSDLKEDLSACERFQRKPFYKIALLKGHATYHSQGEEIPISGYSIVFTDPLTRSSFYTNDIDFEGIYCICSDSFLRGTAKVNFRNWPVFQERKVFIQSLSPSDYQHMSDLFRQIEDEHASRYPFREQVIRGRIFDIIHYIQKSIFAPVPRFSSNEDRLDQRFLRQLDTDFLDINPGKPLRGKTPLYFATQLNCTVDHLNQTLKKIAGKTTQQLIHERILEEADVMLRHSDYSIKEIAWSLHFQESQHFINFYKKHTDKTPTQYRNH